MPWVAAVGALGAAGIGAMSSAADRSQAAGEFQQAVSNYQALGVPQAQALQLTLEHYKNAGLMTPELEQAINQSPTLMKDIQVNPDYTQAQQSALNSLQQIGNNGGMLMSDKAAMNNAMNQAMAAGNGQEQAILAQQARTGQLGSGLGLAMREANAQNAANQANNIGLNTAGMAQQRALQALQSAGQLGTEYNQQSFNQQAATAQAQDTINRYNAANSQNVLNNNVGFQNAAQMYNLQNQQSLDNANTGVDNQQSLYNSGAIQQAYEDQLQKTAGMSGAQQTQGNFNVGQSQQTGNQWGGIGQGVAQIGTGIQNQNNFDAWLNSQKGSGAGSGSLSSQIANYKLPKFPGDNEDQ